MSLRRPTITDARGRRVPLLPHEILAPGLSDPNRRERLQRAGWYGGARVLGPRAPRIIAMLIVTMAVFCMGPVILISYFKGPPWMQTLTAFLPALVSVLASIFWMRRLAPDAIGRVYLRARFCASCGYDLTDTPLGADALTLCPECGAAWNLAPKSEPRA